MDYPTTTRAVAHLISNMLMIKDVTVTYHNGSTVSGFIVEVRHDPDVVVLCQHSVLRHEDPHVVLDFRQIAQMEVELHGGQRDVF